jgi:hypothetical protein
MSFPEIVIKKTDEMKCHLAIENGKTWLHVPLFMMGAIGEPSCFRGGFAVEIMKDNGMDRDFWKRVAMKLKKCALLDWDWYSLQRYVITPNLEHIRIACDVKRQSILERFEEDGSVFLNNWFDDEKAEGYVFPNGASCFDVLDVEY